MTLSIKTREAVIKTLTKAEQDNPTPLELGRRLKDCFHRRLVWEPYTRESTKNVIYRFFDDGTIEQLPLIDFSGRELKLTYKKPKD